MFQLTEVEKERGNKDKIDNLTEQYEERLTELHSVIAELTRKIDRQNDDVIIEEDEEDLEEIHKEQKKKIKNKRRSRANNENENEAEKTKSYSEYSSHEQNETTGKWR